MKEINAILVIGSRDLIKFLRDRPRILGTLIFPLVFVGILGGSFQSGFGEELGFDFRTYVFTGVLAQTLFQTTALGIISIIEDRENDFSQEIFVSPISRYSIIGGKIFGESMVAMLQAIGVIVFGLLIGIPMGVSQMLTLFPVALIVSVFGASFGLVLLANLNSQRAAQQIFPFFILPQFFLAGVFTPIQNLPWYLEVLSRIAPMRYAVELTRNFFYAGRPEYETVVVDSTLFNLSFTIGLFLIFLYIGTTMFVRRETSR